MSEHKHRWWAKYRVVGRWHNQHGRGSRVVPDGSVCECGGRSERGVPVPRYPRLPE